MSSARMMIMLSKYYQSDIKHKSNETCSQTSSQDNQVKEKSSRTHLMEMALDTFLNHPPFALAAYLSKNRMTMFDRPKRNIEEDKAKVRELKRHLMNSPF